MKSLTALLAGTVFGLGLAASGMTNPEKIHGFLDIFGRWDPDLLFVMASAVIVTACLFPLVLRLRKPVCDQQFHLPRKKTVDKPLIFGAMLFGMGWGLYGYCPGPALAALTYLDYKTLVFVVTMLMGMAMAQKVKERWRW